jgi:hypothetical protein
MGRRWATIGTVGLGLGIAAAALVAACTEPLLEEADAGAADAGTGDTSARPDARTEDGASAPDTSTSDAGAGDATPDGTTGDSGADASDAGSTDAADAADAADATAPPPRPTTTTTLAGILDFDMTGAALAMRTAAGMSTCALPACATVTGPFALNATNDAFAVAGTKIYFVSFGSSAQTRDLYSINLDGTGNARNAPNLIWTGSMSLYALDGSQSNVRAMFRAAPPVGGGRFETRLAQANPAAPNTDRIGRPTATMHSNVGATVSYGPAQNITGSNLMPAQMTTTGATLPVPATPPTAIAVSERGATVTYPAVVILRNGNLEACPTAADCAAWMNLGALGTVFNLDGTHLYVGSPTGLSRCTLQEIATAGTCTLAPHVTGEPVEAPILLTSTEVWYRSGANVRRVGK